MRSALAAFLVDSNILIYAHDPRDKIKQQLAFAVLDYLIKRREAALSVQCLSEFFNTVRMKLPEPLSQLHALAQAEYFLLSCRVLSLTPLAVIEACRCSNRYGISVWDSLIWAVARLNGLSAIISEDTHGDVLEGVRYLNPFHPDFQLSVLEPTQ
jgi:predicted nucleic acid-binding protein